MKKNILISAILASGLMLTGLQAKETPNPLLKNIKVVNKTNNELSILEKISNLNIMKLAKLTPKKVISTNGMYYVTVQTQAGQAASVFVTKDLKLLIHSGVAINTQNGASFTPPANIEILKGKENFSYGTGKKTIYVFTDPECPYCQRFEKEWGGLKDKYTMKVFLMPLSFHKNSKKMIHWILSAKNDLEKAQRLLSIEEGNKEYQNFKEDNKTKENITQQIKQVKQLAIQNSVRGTPTVFDANGNSISWTSL